MKEDVAGRAHGVLQVALDLVQDVLEGTPDLGGAGFDLSCFGGAARVLALGEEGEVLVADLLDLEQTVVLAAD